MSEQEQDVLAALNRLCKWRTVLAGWQLGTRPVTDGPTQAVRDHRDQSMVLRVEVTALSRLLLEKGVFTEEEFQVAIVEEAEYLSAAYVEKFPGMHATDEGITFDIPEAADTMQRMGFPP